MNRRTLAAAVSLALLLPPALPGTTSKQRPTPRAQALHVLNRLGFGARPGDVERVLHMGVAEYVERQLQPERISESPDLTRELSRLDVLELSGQELFQRFELPRIEVRRQRRREAAAEGSEAEAGPRRPGAMIPPEQRPARLIAQLQAQRLLRSVYSERQLEEVLVVFWMNHFNVDARKARIHTVTHERDAVRPHVLGRFEELLLATAKSPAMLLYLDNARSVAPGTDLASLRPRGRRRGRQARPPETAGLEEGLARAPLGLNENYARELLELHTLGVEGGYTQKDVTELARVLTGWTVDRRSGDFAFRPALHDRGEKLVLGQKIAAGGGMEEGMRILRFLARHPSTARHLATKLCRRLVADEPPAALVERVAKIYLGSGGDLRETVRAVVTSPEFYDPANYRVKIKSPLHLVASTLRAAAGSTDGGRPVQQIIAKLGEPLYLCQPPTGYGDTAADWISAGGLVDRMNFAVDAAAGRISGIRLEPDRAARAASVAELSRALVGSELSAASQKAIEEKLSPGFDRKLAAGLVLGSPEFQRM